MLQLGKLLSGVRIARYGPMLCGRSLHASSVNFGSQKQPIRIGCASGFWGDTMVAAPQLIRQGKIQYLVLDYLSEITMSLLAKAKKKIPTAGYTPDFVSAVIQPNLAALKANGIRVVANAGGVNVNECAAAIQKVAKAANVEVRVATIQGDDMISQADSLRERFVDLETGGKVPKEAQFTTANAYLGAGPIARALAHGADIVVTGRCVDSALVLGPLMHEFGWQLGSNSDLNRLALGSLAGHLVECGAQSTGGIFTDWRNVQGWEQIGFPIVEVDPDGQFTITKPERTGGVVSFGTVAEQLVYEIHDPRNYVLPDVVCDFADVHLTDLGKDRVRVTNARGKAAPDTYKVCATYENGYRATAVAVVIGPDAKDKAKKTSEAIVKRVRGIFKALKLADFCDVHTHLLGTEQIYGKHAANLNPREVVMWTSVRHQNKKALEIFAREIAAAGTGMAPGLTGLVGGRPRASEVLTLFSFLHPRTLPISIHINGQHVEDYREPTFTKQAASESSADCSSRASSEAELAQGSLTLRLGDMAYLRSGDKANTANIGVIARNKKFYPYLKKALTEKTVAEYFEHLLEGDKKVRRFELPGVNGLNFVLPNSLGGGGVTSLRVDPQGKSYGQMLADLKITSLPNDLLG